MEVDTETGATTMRKYVCVDDIGVDRQPAHRRGPGPRRPRPGHRAGALGGRGVRRERHPRDRARSSTTRCRPRPTRSASSPTGHESPSTTNTLGTKGVGEAGTIASTPAVVNAIVDALRPIGVHDVAMPCTPERVWRAIQAGHAERQVEGEREAAPHFDEAAPNQDPGAGSPARRPKRSASDPRIVRLPGARRRWRRPSARSPSTATRPRCWPAGSPCCRSCACASTRPESSSTSARIAELQGISEDGDHLVIGAMTTYAAVLASEAVSTHAALLSKAIHTVADPQIRHRGTIGGALVHADPAGDVGAPVLALGCRVRHRRAGWGDAARSPATTSSRTSSRRRSVRASCSRRSACPKHTGWGAHYEKFVRVSHQWSIVAVAADRPQWRAARSPRRASV